MGNNPLLRGPILRTAVGGLPGPGALDVTIPYFEGLFFAPGGPPSPLREGVCVTIPYFEGLFFALVGIGTEGVNFQLVTIPYFEGLFFAQVSSKEATVLDNR